MKLLTVTAKIAGKCNHHYSLQARLGALQI